MCGSLQLNRKLICLSQSLIVDIHVPTLHLLFHPQSPVLTDQERLSPALPLSSHSSKVTSINSAYLLLHRSVKSFISTKNMHYIALKQDDGLKFKMRTLHIPNEVCFFYVAVINILMHAWLYTILK